mmetsp:Transcript_39082/g.86948  ORF Transcript_39082/g.86948 Transcript_39082/m.86948 type:complete len:210 (-) Transcript_39082:64-693(-)
MQRKAHIIPLNHDLGVERCERLKVSRRLERAFVEPLQHALDVVLGGVVQAHEPLRIHHELLACRGAGEAPLLGEIVDGVKLLVHVLASDLTRDGVVVEAARRPRLSAEGGLAGLGPPLRVHRRQVSKKGRPARRLVLVQVAKHGDVQARKDGGVGCSRAHGQVLDDRQVHGPQVPQGEEGELVHQQDPQVAQVCLDSSHHLHAVLNGIA